MTLRRFFEREQHLPTVRHNISASERVALKAMRQDNLEYTPSDKGGELTVVEKDKYNHLCIEIAVLFSLLTESYKHSSFSIA
jgi:hypothetical protein